MLLHKRDQMLRRERQQHNIRLRESLRTARLVHRVLLQRRLTHGGIHIDPDQPVGSAAAQRQRHRAADQPQSDDSNGFLFHAYTRLETVLPNNGATC